MDDMKNNQKNKSGRGGARPGAGRKKGAFQKMGGVELLEAIKKKTGKTFADNIAEHYMLAITNENWADVRDYEKFIIQKVMTDVKEVDITSDGEKLGVQMIFKAQELTEWNNN